jgi:RNA polymerase sigma-70 factor (ECF subfamily)
MRRIYLEGESVDTVSRAMNITKEQIYNHTSRSKSKLRKALAPGRVI